MAIRLAPIASYTSTNEVVNAFEAGTISWSFAYGAIEDIFEEGVIPESQWDAQIVSLIGQNPRITASPAPTPTPGPPRPVPAPTPGPSLPVSVSETKPSVNEITNAFKAGTISWSFASGAIEDILVEETAIPESQWDGYIASLIGERPSPPPSGLDEDPNGIVSDATTNRIRGIVDTFKAGGMGWNQAYHAIINALKSDPAVPGDSKYSDIAVGYIGEDPKTPSSGLPLPGEDVLDEDALGEAPPTEATPGVSPLTQYLQLIGQGTPGIRTQQESFQASLFDPIKRLFGLEQQFGPATSRDPTNTISEYLAANALRFSDEPGAIAADAGDILRGLLGIGEEGREMSGTMLSGTYPYDMGGQRDEFAGVAPSVREKLFQLALRPLWGVFGADRFASRLPREESIWERKRANDSTTEAFLEWLMTKYAFGSQFTGGVPAAAATDQTAADIPGMEPTSSGTRGLTGSVVGAIWDQLKSSGWSDRPSYLR